MSVECFQIAALSFLEAFALDVVLMLVAHLILVNVLVRDVHSKLVCLNFITCMRAFKSM